MTLELAQTLSALLGLAGGVILAYSLNRVLSEVAFGINAISVSLKSVVTNGDIHVFEGIDTRLKNANRISRRWVRAGLACLIGSFFFATWGPISQYVDQGKRPCQSSRS